MAGGKVAVTVSNPGNDQNKKAVQGAVTSATDAQATAAGEVDRINTNAQNTRSEIRDVNQRIGYGAEGRDIAQDVASTNYQGAVNENKADMSTAAQALQRLKAQSQKGTGMFQGQYGRQLQGLREGEERLRSGIRDYNTQLETSRREIADEMVAIQGEVDRLVQAGSPIPQELRDRYQALLDKEKELTSREFAGAQGDDAWSSQAIEDEESLRDLQGRERTMVADTGASVRAQGRVDELMDDRERLEKRLERQESNLDKAEATYQKTSNDLDVAMKAQESMKQLDELEVSQQETEDSMRRLLDITMADPETSKMIGEEWTQFVNRGNTADPNAMWSFSGWLLNRYNGDPDTIPDKLRPIYDATAKLTRQKTTNDSKLSAIKRDYQLATGNTWYE